MEIFIRVIADYNDLGDFNAVEFRLHQVFAELNGEWSVKVQWQPVEPFSTINTGYWVQEHGLEPTSDRVKTLLIVNTATRSERPGSIWQTSAEPLVYGRLNNRVEVLAFNSGHSLSWVRGRFRNRQLFEVAFDDWGSQFRSRDALPAVVGALMDGRLRANGTKKPYLIRPPRNPRDPAVVPPPPERTCVVRRDGYDNLKLSDRESKVSNWPSGMPVRVTVGERLPIDCTFQRGNGRTPGMFGVPPRVWVLTPGSSGHEDPFLDLCFRRIADDPDDLGGATKLLGGVEPGTFVEIEPQI